MVKREPALMLPLSEIDGEYQRGEGEFDTNYLVTADGDKISRVNVWGNVVRKYEGENFISITIDDFTGTIDANAFENLGLLEKANEGDVVRVIGKIREGRNGLFILAEGLQKLSFDEEMLARAQNVNFLREWKKKSNKITVEEKSLDREKKSKLEEAESFFTEASSLKVERNIVD